MAKILRSEPARSSQTCGYQISVGAYSAAFCGEPKVRGLYYCQEHHDWLMQDEPDGRIRMAPGNVVGR